LKLVDSTSIESGQNSWSCSTLSISFTSKSRDKKPHSIISTISPMPTPHHQCIIKSPTNHLHHAHPKPISSTNHHLHRKLAP
jgi:hypothetical protein